MMRRRHLCDRFLRAQVTPIVAIVNPESQIRLNKVTNYLRVQGIQYLTISDSYLTS